MVAIGDHDGGIDQPGRTGASKRRNNQLPSKAEQEQLANRIHLQRLMRRDAPGVFDWPAIANRLADELTAIVARVADLPGRTAADDERIERAAAALRDFQAASMDEQSGE
jgi:hypothetical protein